MDQKNDIKKGFMWYYFELKFKSLDTALKLQAKEYERRLDALNGENDKIQKILEQSIPREVFDRTISNMRETSEERLKVINESIKPLTEYKIKQEGSNKVIIYLIGIAVAIIIGMAVKLFTSKI
jgi:hypothetical protein